MFNILEIFNFLAHEQQKFKSVSHNNFFLVFCKQGFLRFKEFYV